MPPTPRNPLPRIVVYYQTHQKPDGSHISILPLIQRPDISVTHIIVAAIHLNEDQNGMTLNDHPPHDPRFATVWAELRIAQASGIKVMGMLGGAAKGSYARLDQHETMFEDYYGPLARMVRERGLDGLDLDVEEEMTLAGVVRLIDRLRADFGPDFIISLAPVAAALVSKPHNLSGFDYEALEVMRGRDIAWYNAQFYCGWGDAATPQHYQMCVAKGFPPEKVVMGLVTNPDNGAGFVPHDRLALNLGLLRSQFPTFGGVMGWEYFNGQPGGRERPWEWAAKMTEILRPGRGGGQQPSQQPLVVEKPTNSMVEIDPDSHKDAPAARPPHEFEYYSDGLAEEN